MFVDALTVGAGGHVERLGGLAGVEQLLDECVVEPSAAGDCLRGEFEVNTYNSRDTIAQNALRPRGMGSAAYSP